MIVLSCTYFANLYWPPRAAIAALHICPTTSPVGARAWILLLQGLRLQLWRGKDTLPAGWRHVGGTAGRLLHREFLHWRLLHQWRQQQRQVLDDGEGRLPWQVGCQHHLL